MSEKSPYFPHPTSTPAAFDPSPAKGPEEVSTSLRRIQADAEQICTDAVDIEDARFLAADILEVCRRFVSDTNAGATRGHSVDCGKGPVSVPAATHAQKSVDASQAASARAKLGNLSSRELEIFTSLAEGFSAAEIAARLSRSTKTVNNHRTRILQKLGLKNSAELVRLALKSGVVTV